MKALVFGQNGQLAQSLEKTQPGSITAAYLSSEKCDVRDSDLLAQYIKSEQWDLVINTTAYTQVDLAESEIEQATQLNTKAPAMMAKLCQRQDARFIHVSTDFVFDGLQSSPYSTNSETKPQGVYGQTKAEGEKAVLDANPSSLIIRTSWLYSSYGNNFVKTMLKLMQTKPELGVIADQIGTPTWAQGLARFIWQLGQQGNPSSGILHWSDAGVASWYDFAVAVQEEALAMGLLPQAIPIKPLTTEQYPTPAPRPAYSVMDKQSSWQLELVKAEHWRVQLREMLQQLHQLQTH